MKYVVLVWEDTSLVGCFGPLEDGEPEAWMREQSDEDLRFEVFTLFDPSEGIG